MLAPTKIRVAKRPLCLTRSTGWHARLKGTTDAMGAFPPIAAISTAERLREDH
jgi:hypothetical protein